MYAWCFSSQEMDWYGWGRNHEPQLQLSQVELSQVQVELVGGGAAPPPPPPPPQAESVTRTNSREIAVNTRLLVMIFLFVANNS